MKKLFIALFALAIALTGMAQVTKTVNVTTAGTLSSMLTAEEKNTITDLTVIGNIDARDFICMRDEINFLSYLDLRDAIVREFGGFSENEIPECAFIKANNNWESVTTLKTIIFPSSLTSIGRMAFQGCIGLSCVLDLPETLQNIGVQAFMDCSNLTGNLIIPNSVKTIGSNAFYNCSSMSGNIIIGNSVEVIDYSAFENCSSLTGNLIIPNSVITIGQNAFQGCRNLTGFLTIGDSVKTIGEYAFFKTELFGELSIPSLVQTIGKWAFAGLNLSGTLTIGNSVKTIGDNAFRACRNISKVIIGDSVSTIGTSTFEDKLNSNIYEYSVSTANQHYSSIDGILLNKNKTVLIAYPSMKIGICNIPSSVIKINDWAFAGCSKIIGEINIPNSVSIIGNFAFWSTRIEGAIYIPASVTEIGESAFLGNNGLISFDVAIDNQNYTSSEGVLFNKNKTTLISYPVSKTGPYNIPNSVDSIAVKAFAYSSNLTNLQFGNSIKTISNQAFLYCSNLLGSLFFPSSLVSIGNNAFEQCNKISEIYLPNSVVYIGEGAFSACSNLTKVSIDKTTPIYIQPYTFGYIDKNQCVLEVPQGSKPLYQDAIEWKNFINIVEMLTTNQLTQRNIKVEISKSSNIIHIQGTRTNESIALYSTNGSLISIAISTGDSVNIPITTSGLYLLRINGKTYKIVL